jgi:hypothetical protein
MNSSQYELEALVLTIPHNLVKLGLIDSEDEYSLFYTLRHNVEAIRRKNHKRANIFTRLKNKLYGSR